jgi:NAD(P)-dependent dehydrogenase (short-subunit alcohol dehydrogenase family)
MKLDGSVVVVTGAGSGLGRQLTIELLRRGARVAAVDVRADGLAETEQLASAGSRLSVHVVDITDRAAVEALPEQVIAHHGTIDAVINNAGIMQPFVTVAEADYALVERILAVNFWGTLHMVKTFLPHLMARPAAHVVNVASMGAFLPVPGQSIYGASKAAVKLLTEGLYAELLDTDVRVTVVLPGGMGTDIARNSGVEIAGMEEAAAKTRVTSAPDAARTILDGMEADRLHILVGRDAKTMMAAVRLSPTRAIHLIQKQMKHLMPQK